jgi:hypothetical protein
MAGLFLGQRWRRSQVVRQRPAKPLSPVRIWTSPPALQMQAVARGRNARLHICGHGSVGRASPCQGGGRGFESRCPLQKLLKAGCPKQPAFLLAATLVLSSSARMGAMRLRLACRPADCQDACDWRVRRAANASGRTTSQRLIVCAHQLVRADGRQVVERSTCCLVVDVQHGRRPLERLPSRRPHRASRSLSTRERACALMKAS